LTLRIRHIRLRVQTESGLFGTDIPLKPGLNVLWADNTRGKSTCLQGLLYALGLERMLSPRHNTVHFMIWIAVVTLTRVVGCGARGRSG
jgi:hypothetical protein